MIILIILISKHKINNSIYINLKDFIKYIKLNVISHDQRALKNTKKILLNKYYKSQHIQYYSGLHLRVIFVICRLYHDFRTIIIVKPSYNRFITVNHRDTMVFYLKTFYNYTFTVVL